MKSYTNTFKNSFEGESKYYEMVDKLVANDPINFSPEYVECMHSMRNLLNSYFCGRKYRTRIEFAEPGSNTYSPVTSMTVKFGELWEDLCSKFWSDLRKNNRAKAWPRGKSEFPDFCEGYSSDGTYTIPADFKSAKLEMKKTVKYINFGGECDLEKDVEFDVDFKLWKSTGIMNEHLKALLVYAIYTIDSEGVVTILNVMVVPAFYALVLMHNNEFKVRSGKVVIGFNKTLITEFEETYLPALMTSEFKVKPREAKKK